jgi:hypothetical protein
MLAVPAACPLVARILLNAGPLLHHAPKSSMNAAKPVLHFAPQIEPLIGPYNNRLVQ